MHIITPEELGFSSRRLDRIGQFMQDKVNAKELAGVVTLVARQGQVVHLECCGSQDIAAGKPMPADAIFRLYSMTKPITCVALMSLFEEGLFLLDDPVSRFIPAFSDLKVFAGQTPEGVVLEDLERPVTIRHLLTHTAGLSYGDRQDSPVEDMYRALYEETPIIGPWAQLLVPLQEMSERVLTLPLVFQPGQDWRYGFAHSFIAYLVSLLADMPFDVFLQERLFDPLRMVDTAFYVPENKLDRLTTLYARTEDDVLEAVEQPATSPYTNPASFPYGCGGLVSTVPDIFRFCQMMLNGGSLEGVRLLSPKTVAMMTTNHLPEDLIPLPLYPEWTRYGYGYGLGVEVLVDVAQSGVLGSVGEYGWAGAAMNRFWVDPKEELVFILMLQLWRTPDNMIESIFKNLVYQSLVG